MDTVLQRHIFYDRTIDPHPDKCLILKGFYVDITGSRTVRPLDQAVQEVDHRRIVISILDLHLFNVRLYILICLKRCILRGNLCIIIPYCPYKRYFFTQIDHQLLSCDLPDIFKTIKIQRIVDNYFKASPFTSYSKDPIFFCSLSRDPANCRNIDRKVIYIHYLTVHLGCHGLQHLIFCNISLFDQYFSKSFPITVFLYLQCFFQIFLCQISLLDQYISDF